MTKEQFERMPLSERIHLILSGKVQFIRDGAVIPVTDALKGVGGPPKTKR